MEKTLVIIKPDAVEAGHIGEIISAYEKSGLKVEEMSYEVPAIEKLEEHYAEHKERSFYPGLIGFMSSGRAVFMVLSGEGAIAGVRNLNGATNPEDAASGTIRKFYGADVQRNAVHGSENAAAAEREIKIWFE